MKPDEPVAADEFASNRLVSVENVTGEEGKVIQKHYGKLSDFIELEENLRQFGAL